MSTIEKHRPITDQELLAMSAPEDLETTISSGEDSERKKETDYFFGLLKDMENHNSLPYVSGVAQTATDIGAARKLHADVYQGRGYVDPGDIDDSGHLVEARDPYVGRSRYFLVERRVTDSDDQIEEAEHSDDGELAFVPVAGGRQIEAEDNSFDSFQFFDKTGLSPEDLEVLENYEPEDCVEVSALVKAKGEKPISVLYLYRDMLDYSQEAGHKLWLMVINVEFYDKLQLLFGDAVEQVGDSVQLNHLNMTVKPAILDPNTALQKFQEDHRDSEDSLEQRYEKAVTNFFSEG